MTSGVRDGCVALVTLTACAQAPTYLRTSGDAADREAALGWILLIVSLIVIAVVSALVLVGSVRGRRHERPGDVIRDSGHGLPWIAVGGVAVPVLVLVVLFVYSMSVLEAVAGTTPTATPALTVRVVGHRWWWEVRYVGGAPNEDVVTANEIHIPTGRRVRLELETADVIHSFWVPELAGKTDLIPGQRNVMWLQADTAGRYRGQCAEYCGQEHAMMGLAVQADAPAAFERWLDSQREPAVPPAADDPALLTGEAVFTRSECSRCHTIRGTGATGRLGPDLTHLASRRTIAAGLLPNTPGDLAGWVANPQALKPGNDMPIVELDPEQLHAVVRYLQSLH
jgi:cytochrome c oxidase subunit 2